MMIKLIPKLSSYQLKALSNKVNYGSSFQQLTRTMSSGRLQGKVAIITASTQGIGYAIAEKFGKEGAHVVVSSRKQKNVDAAVEKLSGAGHSVLGLSCHVGKAADRQNLIDKTVEKFGGIDILVSNAGTNPVIGGVLQCPDDAWDKIFNLNVKNSLQLAQLVVPCMRQRNGGSIVFVSSIAGMKPFELLGAYSVSKTALLGLSKTIAGEVASDNIRVNCLVPGIVKTKFSAALFAAEEYMQKFMDTIPMKRPGQPEDMAGIVAFLCSDEASYITGENFVVAGGMHSRL